MDLRTSTWAILALSGTLAWTAPVVAQTSTAVANPSAAPIKRIPLQRFDVPGTPYETVIGIAEIAPNVLIGRHTHPGPESGYVMEGGFELLVDGEAPRQLKAGDSYQVPMDKPHDARASATGAKVIATYVVVKGKPLASASD
jgi:quercetin dioxygenase-like cupin family protein